MRIYDRFKNSVLKFQLDSLIEYGPKSISEEPMIDDASFLVKTVDFDDRHLVVRSASFLGRDTSDVVRFTLSDKDGNTVSEYDEYPYIEDDRVRWVLYASQSHIDLSPGFDRIAVSSFFNGILETFSISEDGIKNISTAYFAKPDVVYTGGLDLNDNTVVGFIDLHATEDLIYTSFDGETRLKEYEAIPVEDRPLQGADIAIFDWKCKPVKRISTDYRVDRLCVDEEGGYLYAVIKDRYLRSYLGRIRLY